MSKYINFYSRMRDDIQRGVYKQGAKLPSKRTAADLNGISLTTVETAYGMLIDEGYIRPVEKKGYYVADTSVFADAHDPDTIGNIHLLSLPESPSKTQDFEHSIWFRTIRKVINDSGDMLFRKSPQKGCEILRNAISLYLLRYRKMFAQPSNIIIGSGAEQLYETAVLLLGRDKSYGIEDPCYSQIPAVYNAMEVSTVPLKMGRDGIIAKELKRNDFKVLHVTPFHSFPSGISTSASKRAKYLKWASKSDNFIIEDDYASEFFTKGHPLSTLYSLCKDERVIYINTFSKSLSDSMRIGYMIIPDQLMEKYDKVTENTSCTVPVLDQYILADFISSGNFERHLSRKRRKLFQ